MTELQLARLRKYADALDELRDGLAQLLEQLEEDADQSDDAGEAADAVDCAVALLEDAADACREAAGVQEIQKL